MTATRLGAPAPAKPSVQPPARGFRPDVQGLRAIAVSLVVIYHLYPSAVPGGYIGVDVFFAISGFLITGHLLRTFERTGRVGMLDFYGRRARRLMPAAALVLAVTWIASRLVLPTTQLSATAEQIRASALYFQNWVLAHDAVSYLTSDDAATPVQHFWSLSVEEQFYLVWPLIFLVAGLVAWAVARRMRGHGASADAITAARARVGRPVLFVLGVAIVAASFAYSVHETKVNPAAAYFITTTRIWELGLGGALALLAKRIGEPLGRVGLLGWVGLGAVLLSAFVITGTSEFPGSIALLPVGGAVLLLACGSAAGRFGPSRLTSTRPMVFLGDISYSLYLWHWPVIVLWKAYSGGNIGILDGPAILLVSITLAWLTKVLVEDRVRLASFVTRSPTRSLSTVLAAAVPVAMVWIFLANQPAPFNGQLDSNHPGGKVLAGLAAKPAPAPIVPPVIDAENDGSAYASGPGGCQTGQESSKPTPCEYGDTTNPTKTVALVGDSVAGQWFTDINKAAIKHHWKLVMDLHSLCPLTATVTQMPSSDKPYTTCHDWGATVMHDLVTTIKPDVVITSARAALGTPDHPEADTTAFAEIGSGMETYWKQLTEHGIGVVALQETPEMGKDIPDCMSARNGSVQSCSVPASQAVMDKTPLKVAADKLPNPDVALIDLNSVICKPAVCSPVVGNVMVYRDSHHLTKTYTETIEPIIEKQLLKVPALKPAAH